METFLWIVLWSSIFSNVAWGVAVLIAAKKLQIAMASDAD